MDIVFQFEFHYRVSTRNLCILKCLIPLCVFMVLFANANMLLHMQKWSCICKNDLAYAKMILKIKWQYFIFPEEVLSPKHLKIILARKVSARRNLIRSLTLWTILTCICIPDAFQLSYVALLTQFYPSPFCFWPWWIHSLWRRSSVSMPIKTQTTWNCN